MKASKSARLGRIAELIERGSVASQVELAATLADEGIVVSQGTLSKDLLELGAVRVRGADGFQYALAAADQGGPSALARLAKVCAELLLGAEASANLVVLRTPPGAAQYLASAVDKVGWPQVLGTIAGDDTVLLITREADGGQRMAKTMLEL
ncbi:MAG: arginine repressor [Propionibacteriaceae bacterium]|jgi:transcriptional regulator of arginine metabolism|nr:arginine repressor [Propionibacteriaceae bacterium]